MLQWRKQDISPQDEQAKPSAVKLEIEQTAELSFSAAPDWYVKPLTILTAFGLFCGLMFNAAIALWDALDKPLSAMSITGNTQYISKNVLGDKLIEQLKSNHQQVSFLSSDINEIRQLVTDEPWINNASIKRQWPPALEVEVQEQVPVAKWGNKGLLNHQGDIFWPQQQGQLEHLPLLNGPSTDTARVVEQYHTLSQFFKGTDSYMQGLSLQDRGAWTLLLDNEIQVLLGREQVIERLRRFLELYKGHLYSKANQIETVDVRYTNGVAVKWQAQVLETLRNEKLNEKEKKL
jgi:cell division protein FtsQ